MKNKIVNLKSEETGVKENTGLKEGCKPWH